MHSFRQEKKKDRTWRVERDGRHAPLDVSDEGGNAETTAAEAQAEMAAMAALHVELFGDSSSTTHALDLSGDGRYGRGFPQYHLHPPCVTVTENVHVLVIALVAPHIVIQERIRARHRQ